jgi:YVTN family beta-propeller protein
MRLRISGLPAVAVFAVAGLFGSAQTLAQNAYIPNQLGNTVSVLSTATNRVTKVINDDSIHYPFPVAVTPDGSKVYIANYYNEIGKGSVSVISTATNTVTAVINDKSFNMPDGVAVTPDGSKVYVANCIGSTMSVIATATNTVTTITDSSFSEAIGVAVTPDGSKVYVSNYAANTGNTVSVIDTATDTVTTVIRDATSFNFPWGVAVTPDGSTVYVANNGPNFDGNTVSATDTATNTVTATITLPGGKGPTAVAVTPDGSKVYVANDSDVNVVSVIATATNTVGSIMVGGFPTGVAVTPGGRKVYVSNGHTDDVSVIATATDKVTRTISDHSFNLPAGGGVFIQPRFAGTPRHSNCHGQSVAALARTFGGLSRAAAALGYPDVQGLQTEIRAYCRMSREDENDDAYPHDTGDSQLIPR